MNEQGIQKYEEMLAEDPNSRAFAPLAEAYRKTGRLDDAIRVAEAGLKIHPGYSGGLVVLGRAFYEKKELEKATEILKKAVLENPESYLGQKFLGIALMDKGETEGALQALEAANFLSPDDQEVENLLQAARLKASPRATMEFPEEGSENEEEAPQIVTYDQRKAKKEGPGPDVKPEGEEGEKDVSPPAETADLAGPVSSEAPADVEKEGFREGLDTGQPSPFLEETAPREDEEYVEELGLEAVAFLEDAEDFEEEVVILPEDDDVPPSLEMTLESPIEKVAQEPTQEEDQEEGAGEETPFQQGVDQFPVVKEKTQPIVVAPPSFTSTTLAAPRPPRPEPEKELRKDGSLSPSGGGTPEPGGLGDIRPSPPSATLEPQGDRDADLALDGSARNPAAPAGESLSTETLADLYAHQGLKDKAIEIYRKILIQSPGNESVMQKLSVLEGEGGNAEPPPETRENPETGDEEGAKGNDDPLTILESWLENAERMKRQ